MNTVNIYDAKTHLSELVQRAAAGEEIVIARNGKPAARLVALAAPAARRLGGWEGQVWMAPEPTRVKCGEHQPRVCLGPTVGKMCEVGDQGGHGDLQSGD